jgi:Cu-Zn family superoxide dismutase
MSSLSLAVAVFPFGYITFQRKKNAKTCLIEGALTGLTPGLHGIHIHEYGDLREGCASACAHYNPHGMQHGFPEDKNRHVGDLGNLVVNFQGKALLKMRDPLIFLEDIVGRSVVIHADPDDGGKGGFPDSLTTGHSGARIACAVIGWARPKPTCPG